MKTLINILAGLMLITATAFTYTGPKPVKTNFKVYGNCPQCKSRIEAALDTKGIKFAEWNVDTKVLELVYVPEKISIAQVHKLIASVGHDTDLEKAPDTVYTKLPDCCLFRDNPNTHHD